MNKILVLAAGPVRHRLGSRRGGITPGAGSLAAFGPNLMDPARRAEICRAGMAQGRREAEVLKGFWS